MRVSVFVVLLLFAPSVWAQDPVEQLRAEKQRLSDALLESERRYMTATRQLMEEKEQLSQQVERLAAEVARLEGGGEKPEQPRKRLRERPTSVNFQGTPIDKAFLLLGDVLPLSFEVDESLVYAHQALSFPWLFEIIKASDSFAGVGTGGADQDSAGVSYTPNIGFLKNSVVLVG